MTVKRISAFIYFLFYTLSAQVGYGAEGLRSGVHDYRYRVFIGGIEVAELESRYSITDTTYQIVSDLRGVGFLQSLLGIEGEFAGSGILSSESPIPKKFTSKANWRGKQTQSAVNFDKGEVQSFDYSPKKSAFKPDEYPEDVLKGVVDPATMGLIIAEQIARLGDCSLDVRVFTGRHRVDIAVVDGGIQPLPENEVVGTRENVRLCTATATKIRPKDKPEDDKPIVVKLYIITDSVLPYPILLESTYKDINGKAWMVEHKHTTS